MTVEITKLKEITTYLGDASKKDLLERLDNIATNKEFFLTVLGQFSSGKSRLINRILVQDILPVKTNPTTSFVTFVRYGEKEHVDVVNMNGTVEQLPLENLKNFYEGSKEIDMELAEIDYLDVYVTNPLLQKGLVIVDTPGINSTIRHHEELTERTLLSTGKALYVMGRPITNSDKDFVERLYKQDINVAFVRTHIDEIKMSEENRDETLQFEEKKIHEIAGESAPVFFVSNLDGEENKHRILRLKNYLGGIVRHIEEERSQACSEIIQDISEEMSTQLNERTKIYQLKTDELNTKIQAYQEQLATQQATWQTREQVKEEKLQPQLAELRSELKEVTVTVDRAADYAFRAYVGDLPEGNANEDIQRAMMTKLSETQEILSKRYHESIDTLLHDLTADVTEQIDEANQAFDIDINIEFQDFDSYVSQMDNILASPELAQVLSDEEVTEIQENIQLYLNGLENLNEDETMIAEEVNQVKMRIGDLHYEPQYKLADEQPADYAEKFAKIGSTLDWATLLIPGSALVASANAFGKVSKLGKLAGGASKIIKGADAAKDVGYLAKIASKAKSAETLTKVADKARRAGQVMLDQHKNAMEGKEESGSLLDMITFEYWLRKAGASMQEPPAYVLDEEYEQTYQTESNRLKAEAAATMEKAVKLKEDAGAYKNNIAMEEDKLKLSQKLAEQNERKLQEWQAESDRENHKKYQQERVNYYIDAFDTYLTEMSDKMLQSYLNRISLVTPVMLQTYQQQLENQFSKLKQQFDQYIEDAKVGNVDAELAKVKEYLIALEG